MKGNKDTKMWNMAREAGCYKVYNIEEPFGKTATDQNKYTKQNDSIIGII